MIITELRAMLDALDRMRDKVEAALQVAIGERGTIEPDRWISDELGLDDPCEKSSLSDAMDFAEDYDPVEVIGLAEVRRLWAVRIPIAGADGEIEGHEIETFDTKEKADAFAKSALGDEPQQEGATA
jgi:hypothetical protein